MKISVMSMEMSAKTFSNVQIYFKFHYLNIKYLMIWLIILATKNNLFAYTQLNLKYILLKNCMVIQNIFLIKHLNISIYIKTD